MNELNEKNFREIADKLRNNPTENDVERANLLREQFKQFFNSLPEQQKNEFFESVKESK